MDQGSLTRLKKEKKDRFFHDRGVKKADEKNAVVFSCDGSHLLLVVTVWFTFLVSPPKNKTKKLTKTSVNKFSSYRQMTQMYLKPLFPLRKSHFIISL